MLNNLRYRLGMLRVLLRYGHGVRRMLLAALVASLALPLLGYVPPLFYGRFLDEVLLGGNLPALAGICVGYLAVYAATVALGYLGLWATNRFVHRVTFRVRFVLVRGLFRRPFAAYSTLAIGDEKLRLDDDLACIGQYAGAQGVGYAGAALQLLAGAALLFTVQWRLALFACAAIPFTIWLDRALAKRESRWTEAMRTADADFRGWLHTSVQGWREVKALCLGRHQQRRLVHYVRRCGTAFGTWIYYWVARVLILPQIRDTLLMQFCLYLLGGLLVLQGHMGIGALLVFMRYYALVSAAVQQLAGAEAELQTGKPQTDRLLAGLAAAAARPHPGRPPCPGALCLENVSYRYPGARQAAVHGLSLTLRPGARLALCGPSGAGKSTAMQLMAGMLPPDTGSVTLAGVPLGAVDLAAYHRRLAFVLQHSVLLNDTIAENLRYARPLATDAQLYGALRRARLEAFVRGLPQGLHTPIGERGIRLSGGQRQRMVLARALLREVDILFLDEATSALDHETEQALLDLALEALPPQAAVVIAAHRPATIARCIERVQL